MNTMVRFSAVLCIAAFCFAPMSALSSVQLVQKATGTANGSSVGATFTSTPGNGNLLIAITGIEDNRTIDLPSGWSNAINESGAPSQAIFYRFAGASESKTVTVTTSGGGTKLGLQIFEYQNISSISVLDGTSSATGTGTSLGPVSVTTSQSPDLIIVGVVTTVKTSFTAWSNSFTGQNDFQGSTDTFGGADFIANSVGTYSTTATARQVLGEPKLWRSRV